MENTQLPSKPPTWKKIVAFIIDFLLTLFVFGYVIAYLTGNTTAGGFELHGLSALVVFVLMIAYFVLMNRFLRWTIGKKIMRIA